MFPVYLRGKRIEVPDRSMLRKLNELLILADVDDTRDRVRQYAKRAQTPLARVYRQLVKKGLI
jgi:hypothetical protein